jgi:hypothetical protein
MLQHFIAGIYQSFQIIKLLKSLINVDFFIQSSQLYLLLIGFYLCSRTHNIIMTNFFILLYLFFVYSRIFWISHIISEIYTIYSQLIMFFLLGFIDRYDKYYNILVGLALLFFFLSNLYSQKSWCSREHIITHFMAQIMIFLSIGYLLIM